MEAALAEVGDILAKEINEKECVSFSLGLYYYQITTLNP